MSKLPVDKVTLFAHAANRSFQAGDIRRTGGAEAQLYYMANMLADSGVIVCVVTINTDDKQSSRNSHLRILNAWNSRSPLPLKIFGFLRGVIISPSPIYVRTPSLVNALVVLIGRAVGKRVVVGLASDLNCIRRPNALTQNLATWVFLRLSSRVIAQTRDQQALLRQNFGVESTVFHNVIQLQPYSAARSVPFAERDIDVLWIGTIEPRKGLEQVIEVASRLPDYRFAVVGGPRPTTIEYCRQITAQIGNRPNIVAPGFVEPRQVPGWIARSKLLLHTSVPVRGGRTKEGFPNVFLEAWASGLPVVSLHVDPDGLLGSNGLGYKCDSLEEAVEVVRKVTRNEEQWKSTQRNADAYIRTRDAANPAVRDKLLAILAGLPI